MNLRAILAALSLDALVASAADTSATVKALANTLHIMMDLSSLTADAAIDIFPSTVGRFLSDVIGGFELITTTADNEVLALSISKEKAEKALDASMQKDICENYHAFADVYRILMEIVIGKNDTLAMVLLNSTTAPPDTPGQLEDRVDGSGLRE
ncbi:uncharacterized protein N7469_002900 [Penicillium citrinum]|uniref:Uncharacterized protein n=1 Tax=Penicillium citrinum TaxID=5077 RepID=A0A9W9PB68_PENCI|nr:uncharacterized protein N7469_002900 [Penicillium citrinum]KAJ5241309.1 hypothetical protein N7469_002900 [Penicillium citrinum]